MAPKLLVDSDIEAGKRLLQKLDEEGVRVEAALWAFNPESERYQLIISSADVEQTGARPLYEKIQDALKSLPEEQRVPFLDIAVTSPSMGVVANLSTAINTPSNAVDSIRITGGMVNRDLIEDAYIYRLSVAKPSDDRATRRLTG